MTTSPLVEDDVVSDPRREGRTTVAHRPPLLPQEPGRDVVSAWQVFIHARPLSTPAENLTDNCQINGGLDPDGGQDDD